MQIDFKSVWWQVLFFIFLSSLAITAGRVGFLNHLQALSGRYQIYSVCLWSMGVVLLYRFTAFPKALEWGMLVFLLYVFAKSGIQENSALQNHKNTIENSMTAFLNNGDKSGLVLQTPDIAAERVMKGITAGYYHLPKSVFHKLTPEAKQLIASPKADPDFSEIAFSLPQSSPPLPSIERNDESNPMGYIDHLQDQSGRRIPGILGPMAIKGWLALKPKKGVLCEATYAVLTDNTGQKTYYRVSPYERPDLGAYFNQPDMARAGFLGILDVSSLKGTYTITMACQSNDTLNLATSTSQKIRVRE